MKGFISDDDPKPLIPNGIYEAICIKHDSKFVLGKTRKLFLNFKILGGDHDGKVIFLPYNMPYDRRIKSGSKYYKDWVFVNNWQQPSRNAKMSPRIFLNKLFKIRTRTCKPERNNKQMPENHWYSVVDEIVEVITG